MVVPLPFPAPSVFFLTPDICFRKGWQSILGKARTKRPPRENGDPRRFVVEQKRPFTRAAGGPRPLHFGALASSHLLCQHPRLCRPQGRRVVGGRLWKGAWGATQIYCQTRFQPTCS